MGRKTWWSEIVSGYWERESQACWIQLRESPLWMVCRCYGLLLLHLTNCIIVNPISLTFSLFLRMILKLLSIFNHNFSTILILLFSLYSNQTKFKLNIFVYIIQIYVILLYRYNHYMLFTNDLGLRETQTLHWSFSTSHEKTPFGESKPFTTWLRSAWIRII